ncbi:MAG: hypothetical protein IJ733_00165, partial [Lachnospiraceae bacterium]|nr:hypothetical protein [Lachnospiraceae bacterium]
MRVAFRYVIFTIFTAFFGAVYEYFSFGVYSNYMLYAFAFPLVGGVFLFLGLSLFGSGRKIRERGFMLYHYGIITLTVGSLVCGVVEIYGTTN